MIDTETLIAWGGTFKKIAAEETIFHEGQQCNFYYQLVEGNIRWVNINDEGKEFIQVMVAPGECFGEIALFDDEPFAATAVANQDSVIIRLHKSTFTQLLTEEKGLHIKFTKLLAKNLRFKFFLLKELAGHNPENCITALINYFKLTQKNICTKYNKLNLTRQQIAHMTGLRVETVIRTMKHMQQKGDLQITKGKVYC